MAVRNVHPLSHFLRMAVVAGVESAVQIHIDRGDDLNARDDKGQTPLMLSAARNKAAICKLLIEAGADTDLLDPSARNALNIARAAGARDAAAVIESASQGKPTSIGSDYSNARVIKRQEQLEVSPLVAVTSPPPIEPEQFCSAAANVGSKAAGTRLGLQADDSDQAFDLAGWEAEEDRLAPAADHTISVAAFEIQTAVSEHQPVDTSADWDDFDVFLPDWAAPLPRADDADAHEKLRLVLLRAIREGSVPRTSIEDLTLNDDGSPNEEAGALLRMVINDLGAETDERFEYSASHESFEVFVSPEEQLEEEGMVGDAMSFIEDAAERRNNPLRIYQREFQRRALLTADAEVALGQTMECAVERALDALASWPIGISAVLVAARMVLSGAKSLRWMSSGLRTELLEIEAQTENSPNAVATLPLSGTGEEDERDSHFELDAKEFTGESEEFALNVQLLSGLAISTAHESPEWSSCRSALASLALSRGFLMELTDAVLVGGPESGHVFAFAMKTYRSARDQMVVTNLKLVFSIAKKYQFSGEPLDDLTQEGNMGLLKAVERFDWRRGHKFSTYATWWIRQHVGRYVADKGRTIRLPVHVYEQAQRIARDARTFEHEVGRAPTIQETAVRLEVSPSKVAAFVRASLEPISIHDLCVDDIIAVEDQDQFTARDPMEIVFDRQLPELLNRLLATLKTNDERILRLRFGIGVESAMTLADIGTHFELTRERIRQIETKALGLLKHASRMDWFVRAVKGHQPLKDKAVLDPDDTKSCAEPSDAPFERCSAERTARADAPNRDTRQVKSIETTQSEIDDLLGRARDFGFTIHDDRAGASGKLWVNIFEARDSRTQALVRDLTDLGFKFWRWKGYGR
jgi:RNA polymerase primary sigma factor